MEQYNLTLVALSFLVSVFGSFTGLQICQNFQGKEQSPSLFWVTNAAIAIGAGAIWSMHFLGMLAYRTSMPVAYDPLLTFISLLLAVVFVGIGLYLIAANDFKVQWIVFAGTLTGLGIVGMHYTGMAAMVMAADITYDTSMVVLSVVIAIAAATTALWLSATQSEPLKVFVSAVVMGVAVCGMHYTGMAAVTMVPNEMEIEFTSNMNPIMMGVFVFCCSFTVLVIYLALSLKSISGLVYHDNGSPEE